EQAGDDRQERRLAGAVGAEQAEQLARLDRERDTVEGRPVAVALAQVADFEQRAGHDASVGPFREPRKTRKTRKNSRNSDPGHLSQEGSSRWARGFRTVLFVSFVFFVVND